MGTHTHGVTVLYVVLPKQSFADNTRKYSLKSDCLVVQGENSVLCGHVKHLRLSLEFYWNSLLKKPFQIKVHVTLM